MIPKTRFREDILATIHKDRILGIRAGSDSGHLVADLSRRSIWRNPRHPTQTGNQNPRGAGAERKDERGCQRGV